MKYNSPLWFLPCFFVTSVLACFLESIIRKIDKCEILRSGAILLLILLGGISSERFVLPWHIETAISMLVWYELGIAISEKSNSIKRRLGTVIDVKRIAVLIIIFAVGVVATYVNFGIAETSLQVREDIYGNYLLYYIAAGTGIFVFCGISQLIKCNKALEYIGRNSMVILVIHKFPVLFFQELLPITARRLENSNSITGISTGGFVTIVSIMASIAVGEMLKRIAPWTLGIRKNERKLI